MIMRQIQPPGGHRQRLTADRARITDPVGGNRQLAGPLMPTAVESGARTPDPGRHSHESMIPPGAGKTDFSRCVLQQVAGWYDRP
jgi:hypothetical protein